MSLNLSSVLPTNRRIFVPNKNTYPTLPSTSREAGILLHQEGRDRASQKLVQIEAVRRLPTGRCPFGGSLVQHTAAADTGEHGHGQFILMLGNPRRDGQTGLWLRQGEGALH